MYFQYILDSMLGGFQGYVCFGSKIAFKSCIQELASKINLFKLQAFV